MNTYFANFSANDGTHLAESIQDTCKDRIIASIREAANAERFPGSECTWKVWTTSPSGFSEVVAEGRTDRLGRRYRIIYR